MPTHIEFPAGHEPSTLRAHFQEGLVTRADDLSINIRLGHFIIGSNHIKYLGAVDQPVVDDTLNYVYLNSAGVLQINQTGFPLANPHIRLARVSASNGIICAVIDERELMTSGLGFLGSIKAGKLIPGNFSGNPKTASVTFGTSLIDTEYTITWGVEAINNQSFLVSFENKTINGFTVNLNTNNLADFALLTWQVIPIGE